MTEEAAATAQAATEQVTAITDAEPIKLPDDHPLVKTLAAQKEQLKEFKAKAARLDEIEEANKTEAQRSSERLEAAEKRAAELETRSVRAEVAAAKGIPADLLANASGTQQELEAFADALIQFKGTDRQRQVIQQEGRAPAVTAFGPAEAFAAHVQSQLSH